LFGKRGSSGISNVSNDAVDDRFFEKHEYHALTPEQNNTLRSNKSPAPSRRWLPSLTNLACLMIMMMNPQRRRKVPPTAQMLL
jgi:hypothetical protein